MNKVTRIATKVLAPCVAGILTNGVTTEPCDAQIAALPQPEFTVKDENGVDLLSFNAYLQLTDASIGSKEHPLTHTILSGPGGAFAGTVTLSGGGTATVNGSVDSFGVNTFWASLVLASGAYPDACPAGTAPQPFVTVRFAGQSETFATTLPGCGSYSTVNPTGSSLTLHDSNPYTFTYTKRDGTQIIFYCGTTAGAVPYCSQLQQIKYADGRVLTYGYASGSTLPQSVTRSDGLQLKYAWTQVSGVWSVTGVTAINNAYEYCDPTASACSLQHRWPTASYTITGSSPGDVAFTVTDAAGRVTRYTTYANGTTGVKLPTSPNADNITYAFCGSSGASWCSSFAAEYSGMQGTYQNYVTSVIRDGHTWTYSGTPGSPNYNQCGTATYDSTNPVGSGKQVTVTNCEPNMYPAAAPRPGFYPLIQLTDEQGIVYHSENSPLVQSATKPEGNQIQFTWDGNGNLTNELLVPKSGSPLSSVPLAANYIWSGCTAVNCNEPNWVKDGNQNETDYTYDPIHGGILTKTLPPGPNGIRPQTTYTYAQRYAWVLNSSGAYVQSAAPIWVLATETICRTSTATPTGSTPCAAAGDQVVKTYQYGPNSGPNNLFLRGVSEAADGATRTTCYGYDIYGNRSSQTEPRAGLSTCP
ncbi:MAG: hypothetical protein JOZ03_07600 [Gammaproteobacteria bacterium]|nr:hypothetical protein [Gammaproteobacteria bacterium]